MIDYFGKVMTEVRDDVAVATITDRVRHSKAGPNDARQASEYIPFVVMVDLGGFPFQRTPVQIATVSARCYGATPKDARALYVAVSNALHAIGPRTHGTVGLYRSWDVDGGSDGEDPRTKQPYVEGSFQLIVAAAAVA